MINVFPLDLVQDVIKGQLLTQNKPRKIECIRTIAWKSQENELYFDIKEECADEQKAIRKFRRRKTSAVVVSSEIEITVKKWDRIGVAVISVDNPKKAYFQMVEYYRSLCQFPFIEVVGSSGKSTTKDMISTILNQSYKTIKTPGSSNNTLSAAKYILNVEPHHEAAVFEAGMLTPGAIRRTTKLVKPNIGVITTIHRAHFARLGSMDKIVRAKAEILDYLDPDGLVIVNGECEYCKNIPLERFSGKVQTFGLSSKHDIWAEDIKYKDFSLTFTAKGDGVEIPIVLPTFGKYNVMNALAAILTALHLGIKPDQISQGLKNYQTLEGRLNKIEGINDSVIINDNFNANPDSTRLLVEEIPLLAAERPVVLVLGDMEGSHNGEYAKKVHAEVGQSLTNLEINQIITIGRWAEYYKDDLDSTAVISFKDTEEALGEIPQIIPYNSVVILKSSKAHMDLSPIVEGLKA